jgi:5,10-methylenetetrahydromethanopterin reductase
MRAAWAEAGHSEASLNAVAWAGGAVLQPGEPADSPRVIAQAGPRAAVMLHRAADQALSGLRNSAPLPPQFRDMTAKYVEMVRGYGPQGAYYLSNHRGHLMFVRPDERPYLTAELISHATWTATAPELIERIAAVETAGFNQIVFSILPGQEHAVEDWGRIRRAFG